MSRHIADKNLVDICHVSLSSLISKSKIASFQATSILSKRKTKKKLCNSGIKYKCNDIKNQKSAMRFLYLYHFLDRCI